MYFLVYFIFCVNIIIEKKTLLKKRLRRRCFPVSFSKFLKTHFFVELFRWLPVQFYSQRKLCKWVSKVVTIYFISTFLVLVLCLFLASTRFAFTSRRTCGWGNMTFLIFQMIMQLKCHVTFWVRPPYPDSGPYHVLGTMDLVNLEIKHF